MTSKCRSCETDCKRIMVGPWAYCGKLYTTKDGVVRTFDGKPYAGAVR